MGRLTTFREFACNVVIHCNLMTSLAAIPFLTMFIFNLVYWDLDLSRSLKIGEKVEATESRTGSLVIELGFPACPLIPAFQLALIINVAGFYDLIVGRAWSLLIERVRSGMNITPCLGFDYILPLTIVQ